MNIRIMKSELRLCSCCMEEHEVQTVNIIEKTSFKNSNFEYIAEYFLCDKAGELYADEEQVFANDLKLKDAYREQEGLLKSEDIRRIRTKYGITQKDLSTLLGWGAKTITRYESHQVQDRAHDSILKKIDSNPEWYWDLLVEAKSKLIPEVFDKYYKTANCLCEISKGDSIKQETEFKLEIIKKLIKKNMSKDFILGLDFSEEEYRKAENSLLTTV